MASLKKESIFFTPTTPYDNLFENYDETRKSNFLNNLSQFVTDAKYAVDSEANQLKASKLWQKHLGNKYFPDGINEDEKTAAAASFNRVIGNARPYYDCR